MSKHRALLILALFAFLVPVACGGGSEEAAPAGETPGAGPAGGTVTIDLWHAETASNLVTLERLASRYNSSQDEVKVRPAYQGTTEEVMVLPVDEVLDGSDGAAVDHRLSVGLHQKGDSGDLSGVQRCQ